MCQIKEFRELIAVSLFIKPCCILELLERNFLKNKSRYGVESAVHRLEQEGAIYYTKTKLGIEKEIIHIRKSYMIKKGLLSKYEIS